MTLSVRWAAAAVAVAAVIAVGTERARAGGTEALFLLSPQTQTVQLSAGTAQVDVQIQNVSGMTAYQFVLRYDAGVLKNPTVDAGNFLPAANCAPPLVDSQANGPGTVQFGCFTSGQGAGISGSGTLGTVHFALAGGAFTNVVIEKAEASSSWLTSAPASVCANAANYCDVQNGSITVAGGDPAKQQGLSPTPTPNPVDSGSTPPPTPTAGAGGTTQTAPTTGAGGATQGETAPPGGTGDASTAGGVTGSAGSASGAGGASGSRPAGSAGTAAGAGNGSAQGVGKFGMGPPPGQGGRPYDTWAAALASAGVLLLGAGVVTRARSRR